jgi:hypothetical protein
MSFVEASIPEVRAFDAGLMMCPFGPPERAQARQRSREDVVGQRHWDVSLQFTGITVTI